MLKSNLKAISTFGFTSYRFFSRRKWHNSRALAWNWRTPILDLCYRVYGSFPLPLDKSEVKDDVISYLVREVRSDAGNDVGSGVSDLWNAVRDNV